MQIESSLILEGGGMRGVYTAGVLEYFIEKNIEFPYVIGVSAGACHALSYISKQLGRNKKVAVDLVTDPRYIRYRGVFDGTGLFNMDFIFNTVPNELIQYDYDAFRNSSQKLIAVVTDCLTGEPVYINCHDTVSNQELIDVIKASSSLPLMAPSVPYKGKHLLDGGLSDSIPIEKAISDGHKKNVVILTRQSGYRKRPQKGNALYKLLLSKECIGAVNALKNRPIQYNKALDALVQYQNEGTAFVFTPSAELVVRRAEKDITKLERLYELGYIDAQNRYDELMRYLDKKKELPSIRLGSSFFCEHHLTRFLSTVYNNLKLALYCFKA